MEFNLKTEEPKAVTALPLILYHRNCLDGFTAAWVCHKYFRGQAEFFAINYGEALPISVAGRDIYMVDFSMPAQYIKDMCVLANYVTVLDHHKTAEKDLTALLEGQDVPENLTLIFDMGKAGCQITWDFFYPTSPRPAALDFVADRDLWQFKLGKFRVEAVCACLYSYEFLFSSWYELMELRPIYSLEGEGIPILRQRRKNVEQLANSFRMITLAGYNVPVVNAPGFLASEVGESLYMQYPQFPFVATYYDSPDERVFSLRSKKDGGADVSEVAKLYGGGGHYNSAGFKKPLGWEGE